VARAFPSPPSGAGPGEHEQGTKAGASMCTVGLMLSGCTIEDTMPGSPSFLNGQIKGGDVIELVDGKVVSLDTLVDLIRGADRPGSKMELQLRGPDRTLKTIHLLRQPRTQVLERRDLFLMLDEMRSMASSHAMEQRGKKKPDENLIRFLNKTIEDLTSAIRKVEKFEHAAQTKERELRDFIDRVSAVTNQYLGRLDHALASSADDNAESLELVKSDETTDLGQRARENPWGSSHGARNLEIQKRASDAEAALLVQQQAHAAVMLRMQAEVQSLQDQLAFARARGDEPSPTNSDDVTLSGQLSRAKTKMAKLEAELSVAKESLQTKNAAISSTRLEAQAAMDAGRADRESLKACREALQQAQQDLKNLQRSADAARVGAPPLGGSNVGENAVVASLEAQIARMTSEHVSLAARAAAAEKAANQAKEEARILLRKRQADQSALAQVEADVMAVMSSADSGHSSTTSISAVARVPPGGGGGAVGNVGNPQTQHSAHEIAGHELAALDGGVLMPAQREGVEGAEEAGDAAVHEMGRGGEDDASENPNANPEKHKYEAAIIKIGGLQQKVAELQNVIKSYQKDGKTGVLEMQSVTRSATEAKKELDAERQRRNEERSQLTGQFEQTRKTLEEKLAVAEKARTKLQHVLQKKEEQLDKISEQAQKASTRMKEEMNSMQARHEAAWQRTADAVDRLEGETRTAQAERDAAVKAREQQEERMALLESENKRLEAAAAEAAGEAQKEVLAAKDGLRTELEGKEQECAKRVKEITDETTLKVAALQEQLRAAHDSVADSYAMVAQAQAKCVEEVEKARTKEAASKKEVREAKEQLQAEVKKIQRHLAGVTGVKDTEIERLCTRVATLEMTGTKKKIQKSVPEYVYL
jgi:hypothetical protein